ncbi:uncharacterized protein LOC133919901 [Phragmites australis]|uniref:uncharacterized protein LOC133919901 n=1 Tax=Phragmites australis TaxID=29695 RepID=UPI002D77B467|nr:uncharacterized protein LOC133919901 [Phragmites australis]
MGSRSKERGRRKRRREKERYDGAADSRKPGVRAWAGSETKPAKDYYVDAKGDHDNLAFGSLYRLGDLAMSQVLDCSKKGFEYAASPGILLKLHGGFSSSLYHLLSTKLHGPMVKIKRRDIESCTYVAISSYCGLSVRCSKLDSKLTFRDRHQKLVCDI